MRTVQRFLLLAFLALIPLEAFADPSGVLPNPAEIGSSEIYLEIGQKKTDPSISGINLEAPDSFQKAIYFTPTTFNTYNIGVFGGCWSDTGGYDASSPAGCPTAPANNTIFRFYSSAANGTPRQTCYIDKDGQSMSPDKWTDFALNFASNCEPQLNTEFSRPGSNAYVVFVRAFFETDTPVSTGRINAFKLRSNAAKLTFMDEDDYLNFYPPPTPGNPPPEKFFSLQRRTGTVPTDSDGTVGDDFRFEFGTKCSSARAGNFNTDVIKRRLNWSDADHSGAGGNPPNDDILWKLFEKPFGAASFPAAPVKTVSLPNEIGGNNTDRYFEYDFKPLYEYLWRWENVIKKNGIQFRTPFDGMTGVIACPSEIKIYKAMKDGSALPAAVVSAGFTRTQSGNTSAVSTANPTYFSNLRGGVDVKLDAQSPVGYSASGYRFCDQTAQKNCNPNGKNASGTYLYAYTAGNTKTFKPLAGHRYAFYFYYSASTAECVSIVANPSAVTFSQTVKVDMSFKNTSGVTWSTASGFNAKKGSDPANLGPATVAFPATPSTYPGTGVSPFPAGGKSTVKFDQFSFTAPATAGTYPITYYIAQSGTTIEAPCTTTITVGAPKILHKIYSINYLNILKSYVRDNETFGFNMLAYIFPDAGVKGSNNLWNSGIYDNQGGSNDNAKDTRLDSIVAINNVAEYGCVDGDYDKAGCRARVPLTYVPQDDGSGALGNTTPNGNTWLSLRKNQVGGADPYKGGIASTDTASIAGYSGVHLNSVEISNIHVATAGITTTANQGDFSTGFQGKVDDTAVQVDARGALNLPTGSQNSLYQGWDNVRNPNLANSDYTANITNANPEFNNASGGPSNFSANFSNLSSLIASASGVNYVTGTATSYLQDGNADSGGRTYASPNEPLTLSQGVASTTSTNLKWDEYIDWTQVDDKGHWRPTSSGGVSTGFELGTYTNPHYETLHYYSGGNVGSAPYRYTTYYYYCYNAATNSYTYGSNTSGAPAGCYTYFSYATYDYSSACQTTGPTYASNTYGYAAWTTPSAYSSQNKFGWVNTQMTQSGGLPRGQNGQTATSYFTAGNGASNPSGSNTGSTDYWQDTYVTGMPNTGSTAKPAHSDRWIYNTSDLLYSGRQIYDGFDAASYANGYYVGGTAWFCYYNGSGSGGSPATDNSYSQYVDGYYANPRYLYENSTTPTTPYYGLYGNPATFDGSSDGTVDTGWAWVSNKQRVRYENTWNGRTRDLGKRAITTFGGSAANDDLLYSIDNDGSSAQVARGSAIIYNPTIQAANGDIYAGRNIDSYFNGSGLSSAFLYAGGNIQNFGSSNHLGGLTFPGYYPNPTKSDGTPSGNRTNIPGSTLDPIHSVFRDFDNTFSASNLTTNGSIPTIMVGSFNLGGNPKRVYKVNSSGNLTILATTLCGGAGSIYVPGDLTISGNISYCGSSGTKAGLPSVGFIVGGRIIVSPNVTSIVGTYFSQGSFSSGSVVSKTNRSSSDNPLTLNGLVIADSFVLQRQLGSGSFYQAGGVNPSENTPESFIYDGRIVVSPPPGFTDLYNAGAAWNETVPYN